MEGALPAGNVDPLKSRLDDAEEREHLARVFDRGLGKVAGYALPLRPGHPLSSLRWLSGKWFLRREHFYLMPGDSPMGYRLPLDSLPWEAARRPRHDSPPRSFHSASALAAESGSPAAALSSRT